MTSDHAQANPVHSTKTTGPQESSKICKLWLEWFPLSPSEPLTPFQEVLPFFPSHCHQRSPVRPKLGRYMAYNSKIVWNSFQFHKVDPSLEGKHVQKVLWFVISSNITPESSIIQLLTLYVGRTVVTKREHHLLGTSCCLLEMPWFCSELKRPQDFQMKPETKYDSTTVQPTPGNKESQVARSDWFKNI